MCMCAMLQNFPLSFHVTRPLPTLRTLPLTSNPSYILFSASHHMTSKDNCSSSTSASTVVTPARALREPPHRATTGVLFLPNAGNSSHMSSFGGPSPAQQPLLAQFMGVHQPIVGASGTDTRIGVRANANGLYTECEHVKCMACDKEGNASSLLLFLSCPSPVLL